MNRLAEQRAGGGRSEIDEEGSLEIGRKLRELLSESLSEARRSSGGKRDRYVIAMVMSRLTEYDVTKNMLDRYTAPSADAWRFPAELIPALVRATGDRSVLELIAEACGCTIASGADARLAEIGAAYVKSQQLALRLAPDEIDGLLAGMDQA